VIRFLRTWLAIPTESAEPAVVDLQEADRLLHLVCCTKPDLALCGAPITEMIRGTADCIVCHDLDPECQAVGWCDTARQVCPLTEES